jgi:hypothetical protein
MRLFFLLFIVVLNKIAFAQEIHIKSVNESEYPLIKVVIEPDNQRNLDFGSLFIIEKNDTTGYSIDSILNSKNEKAICFLIDKDLTIESTRNNIVEVIKDIAGKMDNGDFINVVLSTKKNNRGNCIYPLSFEFSNKPESFIEFLDIYITSASFTDSPKNMNCSIEQTLEFMGAKKDIPAVKYLIIISEIPYAGGQDWKIIQQKADELGIVYQWFSYTSQNEFKRTYNTEIQEIIKSSMDSLNSSSSTISQTNNKSYILSFYTKQKEKLNQFEIEYKSVKIRSTFEKSSYISFFKENILIFGIIALVIVLILIFTAYQLYTKKQMARSIKELQKIKQPSLITGSLIVKSNFDSLQTQQGTASVVPFISIEIAGTLKQYKLKKLVSTVGRQAENDIVIEDLTISAHHATITKEGGSFYIQDNGSTNSTFVNDIKIDKALVKNGDIIRMGKAVLTLTY